MSETLEELKAIVDNAEESDSFFDGRYLNSKLHARHHVKKYHQGGISENVYYDAPLYVDTKKLRSLSDIKRIIELMEDKLRLDHLQKCNEVFNKRVGSNYGWRVDWNHNRIAVVDTGLSGVSIRRAIDEHIKKVGDL